MSFETYHYADIDDYQPEPSKIGNKMKEFICQCGCQSVKTTEYISVEHSFVGNRLFKLTDSRNKISRSETRSYMSQFTNCSLSWCPIERLTDLELLMEQLRVLR